MSNSLFDSIKLTKPKKNVFDLSHDVKLSCNMGELVPIMVVDTVPGDSFNISAESLLRFAPLVSPVMHRMDVTMHYFFCPNRILWPNWEKYITNTKLETTNLLPAFPTLDIGQSGGTYTRLADYLGIPDPFGAGFVQYERISALPFAAYQKIYDEYYRDQNLQPSLWKPLVDGPNDGLGDLLTLRLRAWEHDYFTSALPFAQKGEAVGIPLGEVTLKDDWPTGQPPVFKSEAGFWGAGDITQPSTGTGQIEVASLTGEPAAYDPQGTLEVSPTTINDLRRAFKLQEWLEKTARGGSRYVESILAHFGVRSSDKRLQRPEYITGTKSPVVISEVLNTTGTTDRPQGDMAGHAIAVTNGKNGNFYCEEHGYIIGIMSVMPKTAYQQGLPKHFTKRTDPTEFFWPSFANIGEQEIKQKEIFAYQGANSDDTFGYIPRYSEYKFEQNRVAGQFRDSLDFWHLGRIFDASPALNADFIKCDPSERIFAVTDPSVDKLLVHVYNKVKAVRPMPKFGTPTF